MRARLRARQHLPAGKASQGAVGAVGGEGPGRQARAWDRSLRLMVMPAPARLAAPARRRRWLPFTPPDMSVCPPLPALPPCSPASAFACPAGSKSASLWRMPVRRACAQRPTCCYQLQLNLCILPHRGCGAGRQADPPPQRGRTDGQPDGHSPTPRAVARDWPSACPSSPPCNAGSNAACKHRAVHTSSSARAWQDSFDSAAAPPPPPPPPLTTGGNPACKYYTVQTGNTMDAIGSFFEIPRSDIEVRRRHRRRPWHLGGQLGGSWQHPAPSALEARAWLWPLAGGAWPGRPLPSGLQQHGDCSARRPFVRTHPPTHPLPPTPPNTPSTHPQAVNPGLTPSSLAVNSFVKLPDWGSDCPEPGNAGSCRIYVATNGDTLSLIATAFSANLVDLQVGA